YTRLSDVHNRIDFARVRIGETDALLPQSAELTTETLDGWSSRNSIAFTHCREYGVEAVIHFDDAPEGEPGKAGTNQVDVPAGVQISMELETPVDSKSSRVGDLLTAHVDADVKQKGKIVFPKGAIVTGRLRRLEEHLEGFPYVLAGLEFLQFEFDGK